VLVDPAHTSTEAWTATAGYDMTTGLGSVNANSLANSWGNVSNIGTTTTLILAPTTGIPHGTTQSVSVTITVKANIGGGVSTGDVSLIATLSGGSTQAFDHFTLANGSVSGVKTQSLPGGTYNVTAHYAGDGVNAPSDSTPVQVTVGTEGSQTFIVVPTFDSQGNLINGNAASVTYGSNYIIRTYVTNAGATPNPSGPPSPLCAQVNQMTCPTGTVALTANGVAADNGTYSLNNAGYTRDLTANLPGGTYSLTAQYSGDNSYNTSSSTGSFTVKPALTGVTLQTPNSNLVAGVPFQAYVYGTSQALRGVAPTGTLTFFDGSTQIGSPVTVIGGCGPCLPAFQALTNVTINTPGSRTLTAQYSGDTNYAASTGSLTLHILNPTTASINVNPSTVNYGATVAITATIDTSVPATNAGVNPTGAISLYGSHDGQISGGLSITTGAGPTGNWQIRVSATVTPQFTEYFSINYGGDANYGQSTGLSSSVTVVIPDFTLSPANGLTLQPVAGQAGSGQITITPLGSIPSTVNLSLVAPVISGYTINLNPQQVSLNGAPVTVTISLAPSTTTSASLTQEHGLYAAVQDFNGGTWWAVSLTTGLGSCFLFVFPGGRKRRAAFGLALVCLLALALGCGGGGSSASSQSGGGGGGGGGTSSPVATSITLSTSNAKVAQNQQFFITATVTSTRPLTGTVTFYNFGNQIEGGIPPTNGQAQTGGPGYINNPGLYQVTATYSGDANNLSSKSSALTQVITGTVPGTLVGQTGGDIHTLQVNFGVQ
jgi:hypothetical protein